MYVHRLQRSHWRSFALLPSKRRRISRQVSSCPLGTLRLHCVARREKVLNVGHRWATVGRPPQACVHGLRDQECEGCRHLAWITSTPYCPQGRPSVRGTAHHFYDGRLYKPRRGHSTEDPPNPPFPHNQLPDRKSTRLNSSHSGESRMPSSA